MKTKKIAIIFGVVCVLFLGITAVIQWTQMNQGGTDEGSLAQLSSEEIQDMAPTDLLASLNLHPPKPMLPKPKVMFDLLEDKSEGNLNLNGLIELDSRWNYPTPMQSAVNLGMRAADSVVFFLTDDTENLESQANTVRSLAERIGIHNDVINEMDALRESITQNSNDISDKIDLLYSSMEYALQNQDLPDLATYISLGGWLESAYILTKKLQKEYSEDESFILAQYNILENYNNLINGIIADQGEDPLLNAISVGLNEMMPVIRVMPGEPISPGKVDECAVILTELRETLISL